MTAEVTYKYSEFQFGHRESKKRNRWHDRIIWATRA